MLHTSLNSRPDEVIYTQNPHDVTNQQIIPARNVDHEDSWNQGAEDNADSRTNAKQSHTQEDHGLGRTRPSPSCSDDESKDARCEKDSSIIASVPSDEESEIVSFSSEDSSTSSNGDSEQFAFTAARAMSNSIIHPTPTARPKHRNCPDCATVMGAVIATGCAVSGIFCLFSGIKMAVVISESPAHPADNSGRNYLAENAAIASGIILAGTIAVGCTIFYLKDQLNRYC